MTIEPRLKEQVKNFWGRSACGEIYGVGFSQREMYDVHSRARYRLEPYLPGFAKFDEGHGKDVLEIGVGMGADHVEWARSRPRSLTGIDLTARAVDHVKQRFDIYGLKSNVVVGDAENLPFLSESFDIVYSWGVIHHTPDTRTAVREIHRVLRRGGVARIMVYHTYSLVGYMLWIRYALLTGRPRRGFKDIYHHHLESPGTKAYSVKEARELFAGYSRVETAVQLSFGDLLNGAVGQRHRSLALTIARRLWPRFLLTRWFRNHGLYLFIEATK